MPKRGERGFTLIELLIVVAILGVLAAVVIPNVGRFIGKGEEEAQETELANIQTAVIAMMTDNSLATLAAPVVVGDATNSMAIFPEATATLASKGADAAFVTASIAAADITAEVLGYPLWGCQIVTDVDGDGTYDAADGDSIDAVNYVATATTTAQYWVTADGTVTQVTS
ncbi:type II secretion system protein [Chloroflexota bacterium]